MQDTSSSVATGLTMHLSIFTAGDSSAPVKCSGTFMCSLVFSSTRWKSMCRTSCLYGWYCTSRSSTLLVLPASSMSSTLEWKASFFRGVPQGRCGPPR